MNIPASQRRFQQLTEGLSLVGAVPVLTWGALKEPAFNSRTKLALGTLAALHVVVDGGLLASWPKKISSDRRKFHIASEVLALLVTVPLTWKASNVVGVNPTLSLGLKAVAVGTLLIDGWLLTRWL